MAGHILQGATNDKFFSLTITGSVKASFKSLIEPTARTEKYSGLEKNDDRHGS
jgi:hypothetical protein